MAEKYTFKDNKEELQPKDIDELLEEVSVMEIDNVSPPNTPHFLEGWFAVCNNLGIIAYFSDETDAFAFRLNYINRVLNG